MDSSTAETEVAQSQEVPRTFKDAREAVTNLTERDLHVKSLIGLLAGKMDSWDNNLDPRDAASRVSKANIPVVMGWLVQSGDFADLAQIEGFIKGSIKKNIDGLTQPLVEQPDGRVVGKLSQDYNRASDQLLSSIKGFVENYKTDPTIDELTFWSRATGTNGDAPLHEAERLREEHNLQRVELGSFVFYIPESVKDQASAFGQLAQQMEDQMGIKPEKRKRVHILLVPGAEYCPRGGFASSDGRRVIVDINHPDKYRVFAHEYTHANLGQALGASKSAAATEGAAVFFARQRFPADSRNDYGGNMWGFSDLVDLSQKGIEVGFSHTQMLERVGKYDLTPAEKYEYAYRFGGFLAEYIVTKFGKEKYLEFYKKTCQNNFFDSNTGKQLVKDGVSLVSEREIVAQALRIVALDPNQIARDFDTFIKERTVVQK